MKILLCVVVKILVRVVVKILLRVVVKILLRVVVKMLLRVVVKILLCGCDHTQHVHLMSVSCSAFFLIHTAHVHVHVYTAHVYTAHIHIRIGYRSVRVTRVTRMAYSPRLADGNWLVKQNQPVSKIETKSDTNLRSLYES